MPEFNNITWARKLLESTGVDIPSKIIKYENKKKFTEKQESEILEFFENQGIYLTNLNQRNA